MSIPTHFGSETQAVSSTWTRLDLSYLLQPLFVLASSWSAPKTMGAIINCIHAWFSILLAYYGDPVWRYCNREIISTFFFFSRDLNTWILSYQFKLGGIQRRSSCHVLLTIGTDCGSAGPQTLKQNWSSPVPATPIGLWNSVLHYK